jgi:hypothetical protein
MNAEPMPVSAVPPPPAELPVSWPARRSFTLVEGATFCLLLALASTAIASYRFGDSNNGITVPILKRFIDPSLYPGDILVATAAKFPTIFYAALAKVLPSTDWVPLAFFVGYVLSIAATYGAAYRTGRWAGGSTAAGLLTVLFAFPVRVGLAGESLYRATFSHSHVASALVLWAIVWFLEGRRMLPILVLSLGAYNHLLYSAYVLVPFMLVVMWEARQVGRRRTLQLVAAAVIPLVPLAISMLGRSAPMTQEWLELLRLRSSHHSFPSAFIADLPDAAGFLLTAVLFASTAARPKRRLFALFLLGILLQFVLGTIFTELHPLKMVLQYQPHRCWRFLLLILYGFIADGVLSGYRRDGLDRPVAVFTGLVVFVANGFEPLLPLVLLLNAAVRRDAAPWARIAAAITAAVMPLWGEREIGYSVLQDYPGKIFAATVLTAAALAVILAVARELTPGQRRATSYAVLAVTVLWFSPQVYDRAEARWTTGSWIELQNWVRTSTPRDAMFLTPPAGDGGFRVFSERAIVGEYKDGTQQYFDDGFVHAWGERMAALAGGIDENPNRFVSRSDADILAIAQRYRASYIVLPKDPPRSLVPAYTNKHYTVYFARPR